MLKTSFFHKLNGLLATLKQMSREDRIEAICLANKHIWPLLMDTMNDIIKENNENKPIG